MKRFMIRLIVGAALGILGCQTAVAGETIFNEDSLRSVIDSLLDEAEAYSSRRANDAYDTSERLADSALHLAESHFGPHDRDVARALIQLATRYYWSKNRERVLPNLERAKAIQEAVFGPEHPELAAVHLLLGDYYCVYYKNEDQDRRPELAEQHYLRAIELLKNSPDAYPTTYFLSLMNLGSLYRNTFRYEESETCYLEAEKFCDRLPQADRFYCGINHVHIGALYQWQQMYDKAEEHYLKSIRIIEANRPGDDIWLTSSLNCLSQLYLSMGRQDEAFPYAERALKIAEKAFGPKSDQLIFSLQTIASIERELGEWAGFRTHIEQIISILEDWYGPDYLDLSEWLIDLAQALYIEQNEDGALESFVRATHLREELIDWFFPYASEEQKLEYARRHPLIIDPFVSLAVESKSDSTVRAVLSSVLKGKATVLDALAAEREIAYCAGDPEIETLINKHNVACRQISELWLQGSKGGSGLPLKDSLSILYHIKDRLEAELGSLCREFGDELASRKFTISDVIQAMPTASILLEYVRYRPFKFEPVPVGQNWDPERYAVFIVNKKGPVNLVNLGDARLIDSLIDDYRTQMSDAIQQIFATNDPRAMENQLSATTNRLYQLVFEPVEKYMVDTVDIFISPHGKLSLLPFELLSVGKGRYLTERHRFSYVSSGRDLLGWNKIRSKSQKSAIVVADPDFNENRPVKRESLYAAGFSEVHNMSGRSRIDKVGCVSDLFRPLRATRKEGEAVSRLLESLGGFEIDRWFGQQADESILKQLNKAPTVLHLATHGFYCGEASLTNRSDNMENPLLLSGLAFAGANRVITKESEEIDNQPEGDDGILTALEATGLNLHGTELVVLSACQTGVGEVHSAEGVYGLRRAFQLAGARSIIMSMFDVPDRATSELVHHFYTRWLGGEPKASALREASLILLNDRRSANNSTHPLFWGGFVLIGEPD